MTALNAEALARLRELLATVQDGDFAITGPDCRAFAAFFAEAYKSMPALLDIAEAVARADEATIDHWSGGADVLLHFEGCTDENLLGCAWNRVMGEKWDKKRVKLVEVPCPCGLATCDEPWEPGCGLGTSEEHAAVVPCTGGGE